MHLDFVVCSFYKSIKMVAQDNINCIKHPSKKATLICLDPHCLKETSTACVLCLKNDHKTCKDEFILQKNDYKNSIQIMETDKDSHKYLDSISETIDDKLQILRSQLSAKQNTLIEAISIKPNSGTLTLDSICEMKNHLKIKFNKENHKIEIGSKIEINEDNFDLSVEKFNSKLEKMFEKLLKNFSDLKFTVYGTSALLADDWIGHANVSIEAEDNGLKVSRKPNGDASFGYYTILMQTPLPKEAKFKLTISAVYEADRFLDFGVVTKSKFDTITSGGHLNSWASGGVSFCGYNHSGGLTGTSKTSVSSDANGYKPGDVTFMEYNEGGEIKFYSEDLTNNLSLKNLPAEEHYLYFVVYHPQTVGILEMIN